MAARKKFAAFDIDGTLYRDALFHDVVEQLIADGALPQDAIHEYLSEFKAWKTRQHEDTFNEYVNAHVGYFEKRLPSITVEQYLKAIDSLFERKKDIVHTYTRDLIKELKGQGYFLIAISGSQIEIVERFAKYYGFDDWVGQIHEQVEGSFTGKSSKTFKGKDTFLQKLIEKHNLDTTDSIAIGDSIGDASMLEMVEQPIAFNPEKLLYNHARERGWKIVVERKNVIYQLEHQDGHYVLAETDR